ncbi:MAG: serine/threonine-protein kinase [Polyangiales bacterium]
MYLPGHSDPHDDTIAAPPSPTPPLPSQGELEGTVTRLAAHLTESSDPGETVRSTARSVLAATPGAESPQLRTIRLGTGSAEANEADFEVVDVLGSGGMGVVYLAWQPALRREVAIKTTHAGSIDGAAASALTEEAMFAGGLEHPNIVPVHALGRDAAGRPVLVMKRVAGVSWARLLLDASHPAWQRLPADRLAFHLNVLVQLSNALHFAHSRGVVHRDLKAENVMIGEFGEVYLLDWGIAWRMDDPHPKAPELVGTPANLAPEMLLGGGPHVTARTDVYLLGAALHRVLTGAPRHEGASLLAVLSHAAVSEPGRYPPTAPRELAAVCDRACAREPEARYASALEFRGAIEEFLQHRSSRQLAERAALRVEALRALLRPSAGPVDAALARQVFAECRFGLREALRTWPENPEAASNLRDATAIACGLELDQRNLVGAEALLAELHEPPAELAARCEVLRRELDDERARLARLSELEHEMDEAVSRPQRVIGTVLTGVVNTGAMGTLAWLDLTGRITLDYTTVYLTLAGLSLAACALYVVLRDAMLATRFNRTLIATFPVAVAGVFVATRCAQSLGLTPQGAALFVAMGVGLVQCVIGVMSLRSFLASGVGYLVAVVVGSAHPSLALASVTVALGFSHAFLGHAWAASSSRAPSTAERPRSTPGAHG